MYIYIIIRIIYMLDSISLYGSGQWTQLSMQHAHSSRQVDFYAEEISGHLSFWCACHWGSFKQDTRASMEQILATRSGLINQEHTRNLWIPLVTSLDLLFGFTKHYLESYGLSWPDSANEKRKWKESPSDGDPVSCSRLQLSIAFKVMQISRQIMIASLNFDHSWCCNHTSSIPIGHAECLHNVCSFAYSMFTSSSLPGPFYMEPCRRMSEANLSVLRSCKPSQGRYSSTPTAQAAMMQTSSRCLTERICCSMIWLHPFDSRLFGTTPK